MMARNNSTFIDPTSLGHGSMSQNALTGSEARPNLVRRGSLGGKPLLNFDEDRSAGLQASPSGVRNKAKSVFGVDTLWEREMTKLKEIEAQEAEELRKQEAAEALRMRKKANKKKKGKAAPQDEFQDVAQDVPVEESKVPSEVPTLPVIQRGITRGPPPPPNGDETESSSDLSDVDGSRPPPARVSAEGWHSGESDKEPAGPVRTTGVGPRYPTRGRRQTSAIQSVSRPVDDDDSEEDMPLAATVSRAVQRATRYGLSVAGNSDSDEEKPLSQLLVKSKPRTEASDTDKADYQSGSAALRHAAEGDDGGDEDEDEDDKPLGLRVSRFVSQSRSQFGNGDAEDDDDRPLALHPEQQRRTQYNMFLLQQQQQQQQQQLLLQAQMQQSMMFSPPSMMGPGFFGAPVMQQMVPMVPPISASPPPGAADMAKFGRVDRWRREIVGGEER
jgi:hypothetical protein